MEWEISPRKVIRCVLAFCSLNRHLADEILSNSSAEKKGRFSGIQFMRDGWMNGQTDWRAFRFLGYGSKNKFQKNKSDRVQTSDSFWRSARVLVYELSFKWHSFMFPMLFCSISAHFPEIQLVCDRQTDERTDGRTDRRTDTPSYRDARTHLITVTATLALYGNVSI